MIYVAASSAEIDRALAAETLWLLVPGPENPSQGGSR